MAVFVLLKGGVAVVGGSRRNVGFGVYRSIVRRNISGVVVVLLLLDQNPLRGLGLVGALLQHGPQLLDVSGRFSQGLHLGELLLRAVWSWDTLSELVKALIDL